MKRNLATFAVAGLMGIGCQLPKPLRVTLREQAAFEAEVIEIAAQQDYFRAVADYLAALGIGGK